MRHHDLASPRAVQGEPTAPWSVCDAHWDNGAGSPNPLTDWEGLLPRAMEISMGCKERSSWDCTKLMTVWRGGPKVGKEKRSQWFVEGQTWGKKDGRDQSSVSELLVRVHVQPYPVPDYHGLSCIVINSFSNYFPRWGDSLFCTYVFATPDIMLLLFRASGKRQKKSKMLDSAIRKFSRERCWRSISLPVRPSVESQIIVFILLGVVDYR